MLRHILQATPTQQPTNIMSNDNEVVRYSEERVSLGSKMLSSASFHHAWSSGVFLNEKSNFLFDWLLCLHELSTIKSIIIVLPCFVWVLCVKELSGWRKSHRLHHGGTFAFLWRKVEWQTYEYLWMNIHFWVPAHSSLWGKCHKVHHLGLEHVWLMPFANCPWHALYECHTVASTHFHLAIGDMYWGFHSVNRDLMEFFSVLSTGMSSYKHFGIEECIMIHFLWVTMPGHMDLVCFLTRSLLTNPANLKFALMVLAAPCLMWMNQLESMINVSSVGSSPKDGSTAAASNMGLELRGSNQCAFL